MPVCVVHQVPCCVLTILGKRPLRSVLHGLLARNQLPRASTFRPHFCPPPRRLSETQSTPPRHDKPDPASRYHGLRPLSLFSHAPPSLPCPSRSSAPVP